LRGGYVAVTGLRLADYNIMAIATQKEELNQQEESRDFFCVVSDAFRIVARRSSMVLGSAWAFASAILIIVIWGLTGPHVSLVAILRVLNQENHHERDDGRSRIELQSVREIKSGSLGPQTRMITIAGVKAHALSNTIEERRGKIRNKSLAMQRKSRSASCSLSFSS
jgi:hypothetical protein